MVSVEDISESSLPKAETAHSAMEKYVNEISSKDAVPTTPSIEEIVIEVSVKSVDGTSKEDSEITVNDSVGLTHDHENHIEGMSIVDGPMGIEPEVRSHVDDIAAGSHIVSATSTGDSPHVAVSHHDDGTE